MHGHVVLPKLLPEVLYSCPFCTPACYRGGWDRDAVPSPPPSPPAIFHLTLTVLGCLSQGNCMGVGLH